MKPSHTPQGPVAIGDHVTRRGDPAIVLYTVTEIAGQRVRLTGDHGELASCALSEISTNFSPPTRLVFKDDRPITDQWSPGREKELVQVRFNRYQNNDALAITLVSSDGEPYMTASVNHGNPSSGPFHVRIKDFAENEGITRLLASNGIINPIPDSDGRHELTPVARLILMANGIGEQHAESRGQRCSP